MIMTFKMIVVEKRLSGSGVGCKACMNREEQAGWQQDVQKRAKIYIWVYADATASGFAQEVSSMQRDGKKQCRLLVAFYISFILCRAGSD